MLFMAVFTYERPAFKSVLLVTDLADADKAGTEEFVAPDENDWVLLLQKAREAN